MGKLQKVGFKATRTLLRKVLKNQGLVSPGEREFFESLILFKRQPGISPLDFISQFLPEIDAEDKRFNDLLMRRFWKNETIRQVAHQYHLSVDQVNRLQRDALGALAKIILKNEVELEKDRSRELIDKLPPPTYSVLFGTSGIQEKLKKLIVLKEEPWIIAICGIGGLGKTALVDSVIRKELSDSDYVDVIWIRFPGNSGLDTWENLVRILANRLFPEGIPSAVLIPTIRKLLTEKPHLIILDNLEGEMNSKWLSRLTSLVNPTRVIITSRSIPDDIYGIRLLKISEMDLLSAAQLLEYQARVTGLDEDMHPYSAQIYDVVGGNPLALKIIVGLLHSWSVPDTLRAIREGQNRSPKELFTSVFEAAWKTLNDESRRLLIAMQFSGEEGAQLEQLKVITKLSDLDLREAIRGLVLRSLVEARGSIRERRYGIHRLTETFICHQTSTEIDTNRMAQALSNIEYWIEMVRSVGAQELLESDTSNLCRAVEGCLESSQREKSAQLLALLHKTILTKKMAAAWINLFEETLRLTEGNGSPDVQINLLIQLGSLKWQLHKYDDALRLFEQAKSLASREDMPERQVNALIGLALANWAKGNLKQAYRNANTAWKIVNNKLPENPVESRLSAVSGIISHARGEYYAADKNFRKASKHLKREPVMLAQIAVNRGLCLQIQKRYNEALKHYRKAERLLVYLDRKGKEIAQIEMLRSSAFFSKGDLINAEAALKRASNLIAEPSDLRTTAFLESSLGRIYLGLGKKREAKKLFKNAAGLWKKVGMPEYELDATGFFET